LVTYGFLVQLERKVQQKLGNYRELLQSLDMDGWWQSPLQWLLWMWQLSMFHPSGEVFSQRRENMAGPLALWGEPQSSVASDMSNRLCGYDLP